MRLGSGIHPNPAAREVWADATGGGKPIIEGCRGEECSSQTGPAAWTCRLGCSQAFALDLPQRHCPAAGDRAWGLPTSNAPHGHRRMTDCPLDYGDWTAYPTSYHIHN